MNKQFIIPIILVMAFMMIGLGSAVVGTITMSGIVAGGNYSALPNITCTRDPTFMNNITNVTINYKINEGAVTVLNTMSLPAALSDNRTSFSVWDLNYTQFLASWATLGDNYRAYNFSCNMSNATYERWLNTTIKNVTIDKTNPNMTLSLAQDSINIRRQLQYTANITDGSSSSRLESAKCMLIDPLLNNRTTSLAFASTSTAETIDGSLLDKSGNWNIKCIATDYAGNTNSITKAFTVHASSAQGQQPTLETTTSKRLNTKTLLIIGIAIVLIYLITKKK